MIPDVPNEIKRRFYKLEKGFDFIVVEIGGTTGDIENLPFLYAAREIGRERSYFSLLNGIGNINSRGF